MRRLVYIAYVCLIAALTVSCSTDEGPYNLVPFLYVGEADSITRYSALLSGNVEDEQRGKVTTLHFRYGTTESMTELSPDVLASNGEKGHYKYLLTDLKPATTYFYCMEGGNGRSTVKSEMKHFVTAPNEKPHVSDLQILSKGPKSVLVTFSVIDDGGEPLSAFGCYVNGERVEASSIMNDGVVKMRIGNLATYKDYQLSAFAANALGEDVSSFVSMTTTEALMLSDPGELSQLLADDRYTYDNISVSGCLNGDDIALLRDMMGRDRDGNATPGRLRSINLADATIVEGGGTYAYSRYTKNNVVGYGMFADCVNVENIVLPDSVVTVEKDAFRNCSSLVTVTIPSAVSDIVPSSGCTSLEEISVVSANDNYCSIDGVLFNGDATSIVWFPIGKKGEYSLPVSVTSVGTYAFQYCSISRFSLPEGVSSLGMGAFLHSGVEEVHLPSTLRSIPTSAFQYCEKLKEVYIGSATDQVSAYAFDGCPLTDIYVSAFFPPVCYDDTFKSSVDLFSMCTLHVPESSLSLYRNAKGWKQFYKIVSL